MFIDFIPQRQSQFFLAALIQRMAKDKTSAEVRVTVLKMLNKILSSPLTHSLMKGIDSELATQISFFYYYLFLYLRIH